MNTAKQTNLENIDLGFIENPTYHVLAYSLEVNEARCAEVHSHPRAQLIYASEGIMRVYIKDKIWVVSAKQAIWVPGFVPHQVVFPNKVYIRNLFIDKSATMDLPSTCFALNVNSFLRELILKIVKTGNDYKMESAEGRLVRVLLDELRLIEPTTFVIPLSEEIHVKKVIDLLLENPSNTSEIETLAEYACTSARNLSRLFAKETGMSLGKWRRQVKILEAMEKLECGTPVSQIAFELGYNSPSAFIEMFNKITGTTPTKFQQNEN